MCKPTITDTICGVPVSSFKKPATPAEIAGLFCALNDEQQAEFFVAVKQIADSWEGGLGMGMQFWSAGGHLAECDGARSVDAIEVVKELAAGFEHRCRCPRPASS